MAINLNCSVCKSSSNMKKRYCRSCGYDFSTGKKYRVVVTSHDGRRVSKVVESITNARKLEGKLKTQAIDKNLFGINQIPLIDDVWLKYLSWAKENKKSWQDDLHRWEKHIFPYVRGKRMDSISGRGLRGRGLIMIKYVNRLKVSRYSIWAIMVDCLKMFNINGEPYIANFFVDGN